MSGHSKWATIKRKKAVTDQKRGKAFTQIVKEITIAARMGGGDPNGNPRLRLAIDKAKAANMPADNIKRGVQKGTGELPGVIYEDVTYEGYGPGGVAMIVESVTDNKNRTVSEVRNMFERNNGKLGASNSVAYMFQRKGIIHVPTAGRTEDEVMDIILNAGADDLKTDQDVFEIVTSPESFEKVRQALEAKGIPMEDAEISMVPANTVKVEGKDAELVLRLMESLEDHDDVQHVYANFDIDEKVLATYQAG
ncbi:MAG TPA: YebC/PmpR family DNA-binding transcriptional regulator [Bacteroidota bacterium]|nr:YebC/PmpR family DNA-binding transcriptional regulator [Bacteroidota bacterium]